MRPNTAQRQLIERTCGEAERLMDQREAALAVARSLPKNSYSRAEAFLLAGERAMLASNKIPSLLSAINLLLEEPK